MKRNIQSNETGSTLVVTIVVVATLLVLLGVAVDYSTQVSRTTQRNRKTALAMEIADGHLEALYTNWRNIYRSTWVTYGLSTGGTDLSVCGTNFFATPLATPSILATPLPYMSPAATPPVIPTPNPSNFPTETNYQLTQYRIQAVDPMVNLDANENALMESGSKGGGNLVAMAPNVQPPGAYGPNPVTVYGVTTYFPYSYYYLAAADVKVPALNGNVTAKVRRVFEKKFDVPWTYAMFYVDDLEFQPSSTFTITGPIHTNGSLYIGTSNFVIASPTYASPTPNPTSGRIEFGGDYVNGYHPKDSRYPGSGFTTPTFAKSDSSLALSDCPPSQVSPYLPFGWNLTLNSGDTGTNNDGYREVIEPPKNYPIPPSTDVDPLANIRYYNQAGIKVLINPTAATSGAATNTVKVYRSDPTYPLDASKIVECTASSSGNDKDIYDLIMSAVKTNLALWDAREAVNVRVTQLDVSKIVTACTHGGSPPKLSGFNGVLYISDMTPAWDTATPANRVVVSSPQALRGSTDGVTGGTAVSTSERAIRLVNGWSLPLANSQDGNVGGLTVVSVNPVYIKGNYNTAAAASPAPTPPSNVTVTSAPTAGSYTRQPAAVVADAINVLSGNWSDATSNQDIQGSYNVSSPRAATSTTINTAMVSGIVPTGSGGSGTYSGGGEGFIRFQEDWRTQNFVYYGSMTQLFHSVQGSTGGSPTGNWFKNPAANRWFYDYATFADGAPPGNLLVAAYLQQQRWYQVY